MTWEWTTWHGLKALALASGDYEALILPDYGANCIALRHASGANLLRTPPSKEALQANPNVYGVPLLFPPNRIGRGTYTFQGRHYTFPINEPARGHHIHGSLGSTPFQWEGEGTFVFQATPMEPYLSFPHAFTVRRVFCLHKDGLTQTLTVRNDSALSMPVGIGFHAAWNIPFHDGDDPLDYRLSIPVKRQWVVNPQSMIPTGETVTDTPLLDHLREGMVIPDAQPLSALLECGDAPICLSGPKGSFLCQHDSRLPFVMLWNDGGGKGFVCPEPQSWVTDAPNSQVGAEATGFDALGANECKVYPLRFQYI